MREFFAQQIDGVAVFEPELVVEAHPIVVVDAAVLARILSGARAAGVRIERVDGRARLEPGIYSTAKGMVRVGPPRVEQEEAGELGLLSDENWWEGLR